MKIAAPFVLAIALAAADTPRPSGRVGIYAIVESVTFEPAPGAGAAERIRIYGAFSYAEQHCPDCMFAGEANRPMSFSPAFIGQLYFQLPSQSASVTPLVVGAMRREWNDIKSVAGSGQAIAFGSWRFIGSFDHFMSTDSTQRGMRMSGTPVVQGRDSATARLGGPQIYELNVGVIKLSAASHPAVVRQLLAALRS